MQMIGRIHRIGQSEIQLVKILTNRWGYDNILQHSVALKIRPQMAAYVDTSKVWSATEFARRKAIDKDVVYENLSASERAKFDDEGKETRKQALEILLDSVVAETIGQRRPRSDDSFRMTDMAFLQQENLYDRDDALPAVREDHFTAVDALADQGNPIVQGKAYGL